MGYSWFFLLMGVISCDKDGKNQCAWTLEADDQRSDPSIQFPNVPACLRNRTTMKQDCRIQVPLELAQKAPETFRYKDLTWNLSYQPKLLVKIPSCRGF